MLKTKSGPDVPSIARHALSSILVLALAALLSAACTVPAYGDDDKKPDPKAANPAATDSQPAPSDHEVIQLLTQQIQQLQARVKQLEENDAAPTAATPSSAPPPAPTSVATSTAPPTNAAAAPSAPPASSPASPVAAPAPTANAAPDTEVNEVAPRLHLNAYGDVGYQASDQSHGSNTFELGSFDLFLTSRLSDKATVLGEAIFLATPDNSINVDLERLMFQYKFNDYFQFGIGRYHTDIGYYNATFHHIQWFSTPIGRPLFLNFDDFGGFLPLQEVGLSMNGNIPSGDLGLHYVAEVGNGRSHIADTESAQNRVDDNQGKSFNINISAHPKALSGLVPGFSYYHDDLTAPGMPKIGQSIMDAYIVYTNSRLEWLNEGLLIRNNPAGERVFYVPAFYTQFSYAFGKYRPYVRYAWENSNNADPLYGFNGSDVFVSRQNDASLGVRYDVNNFAAIKLQYDRLSQRDLSGYDTLAIQFSFSF
jgi:hypothetical protein